MPILSFLFGKMDFSNLFIALDGKHYNTLADATNAGVSTIGYGSFISNIINFLVIAFSVFFFLREINKVTEKLDKLRKDEEISTSKECPYCKTEININASRCPHCTSELEEAKKLQ